MRPLSDLTIVEIGDSIGIRYAGRLLAQLGAKVWRPDGPGTTRLGYGGPAGEAYAAWLDEHKKTGTPKRSDLTLLDEQSPEPGEAILCASLSWFTSHGPYANWLGSDTIIQALSGHVYPFGMEEGPPAVQQGETPQIIAAVTLCIAAVAGLIGRRDGQGPKRIDVNVFEAAMCLSEISPMWFAENGIVPGRRGIDRFFPTFPGNCWRASDGWVGVTTLTPQQWRAFCDICDAVEIAQDPAFATTELRIDAAEQLTEIFAPKIIKKSVDFWVTQGQASKVPVVAVQRPGTLPKDPHWKARDSFANSDGIKAPRNPFRLIQGQVGRTEALVPTTRKPLSGLRVMDLSMGWSGPLATRHLGALGADIIKIEGKSHPDWWRGWNDNYNNESDFERRRGFAGMNTNKRDVLLDLRDPADIELAKKMAQSSDILIENQATGVCEKFGLGHEKLQQIAPGIVSVSMALFGAYGPNASFRGYGSTTEQASGLPFVNGHENWPPAQCHFALGDAVAGLFAAFAALAGVWGRRKYGGVYCDLSQVEVLFQISAPAIVYEQVTGQPVPRDKISRKSSAFTWIGRCVGDDEWLLIDCLTEGQKKSLSKILNDPIDLDASLSDWAIQKTSQAAAALLQLHAVPAAPVQPQHLLDRDPHLLQTGFWALVDHPFIGDHLITCPPYFLDGCRPAITRVAPLMGQHDTEILKKFRNYGVDS